MPKPFPDSVLVIHMRFNHLWQFKSSHKYIISEPARKSFGTHTIHQQWRWFFPLSDPSQHDPSESTSESWDLENSGPFNQNPWVYPIHLPQNQTHPWQIVLNPKTLINTVSIKLLAFCWNDSSELPFGTQTWQLEIPVDDFNAEDIIFRGFSIANRWLQEGRKYHLLRTTGRWGFHCFFSSQHPSSYSVSQST